MPHIRVGDVELYYQDAGQGTPVLLLHNFFGTVESWMAIREPLRRIFRTISVDIRAHGRSGFTEEHLTLSQLVADITNLLYALEIHSVHLIGASIGAVISAQLAAGGAIEARSLTMIGVPRVERSRQRPQSIQGFVDSVLPLVEEEYTHAHRFHGPDHVRGRLLKDFAELNRGDVSHWFDGLDRVTCPVLVVGADNDPTFPPAAAKELAERFDQNELCLLPRAGHLPQRTLPHITASILLDFLCRAEQHHEAPTPTLL